MKRKDLHKYIREQIIDELSEGPATDAAKKIGASNPSQTAKDAVQAAASSPSGNTTITGPKGSAVITKGTQLEEDDIDEMARKAGSYGKGDKFDDAKSVYEKGLVSYVLKAIEELGEEATPANISAKIKEYDSEVKVGDIGTILRNFRSVGIISGGPLAAAPKPEKAMEPEEPESAEPEVEEPKDDWEKPEEEEPTPEEPATVDDKEAEKVGTAQAKMLSPEDEDKYAKLKKGIDAKVARLKGMSAAKRAGSDDLKVLKQLVNRDDVKKLFKAKGVDVKDLIADL